MCAILCVLSNVLVAAYVNYICEPIIYLTYFSHYFYKIVPASANELHRRLTKTVLL